MGASMFRSKSISIAFLGCCVFGGTVGVHGQKEKPESAIENAFQIGLIVQDTNGDHIADEVCGRVIVPAASSAAENTAAANLAARIGYETSALTLPIVVQRTAESAKSCPTEKANLWVGRDALPAGAAAEADALIKEMQIGEGGVFRVAGGLLFAGTDAAGLLAASDGYAARAPYQWPVTAEKLEAIAAEVNARLKDEKTEASVELAGLTYESGLTGIHRAVLDVTGTADMAAIQKALMVAEGKPLFHDLSVNMLELRKANETPLTITVGGGGKSVATAAAPAGGEGPEGEDSADKILDLRGLYGIHGLLSGSAKKLTPDNFASKLYVPAGDAGVAMANLAARMGLESTGITLPVALPETGVMPSQVHSMAVIAGDTALTLHAKDLLGAPAGTPKKEILAGKFAGDGSAELATLKPGEGELQVVDGAFGKNPALLVRGDAKGSAAVLNYASEHLPYLWQPSKKYESLAEMRLDLQKFFSLRSSTGQATAAMFDLDRWMDELTKDGPKKFSNVAAEVDVDEADPKLEELIRGEIEAKLHPVNVAVKTGSLHAGLKCCSIDPDDHDLSLVVPYKKVEPTLSDDFTIPWEGTRLMDAVRKAAAALPKAQPVSLEARVSEGPEERQKIKQQLIDILKQAGADAAHLDVTVLCSYKSGYSWLVDVVEPQLKGKNVAKLKIEFAPNPDPTELTAMQSKYRWNQELFPVDEVLARDLKMPLKDIQISMMDDDKGPTYKVYAYDAAGKEVLTRDFTVKTVTRPYADQFPEYETVKVATGWVKMTAGNTMALDERIETDPEMLWDHYQAVTLPKIYKYIVAQNHGKIRPEYQPLFDTLRIGYRLSEPDYKLGIGEEQISSLEGLQEDAFFNTENFFYMTGYLLSNTRIDYEGRILPVSYPSRDGQDGEVHIAFYAKDAGYPQVKLTWKANGDSVEHEKEQDLPAVPTAGHVRLVAARVQEGGDGVESLTWRMPVDFKQYDYKQWIVDLEKSRVDRTIMSAEQSIAQVQWLEKMHTAGLYRDSLTYPHLSNLQFQFEIPTPLKAPDDAKKEIDTVQLVVAPPATKRPMIADFTPTPVDASGSFVQWEHGIPPEEEEHILSRLSTYPGVDVYWMGRSYLGRNIWAADMTLPTPSLLQSMAKETTLKASIIYSGRQHANEVSSTSHILKLAEQLVTEPKWRKSLDKVNVVIHPITNVDGAELGVDMAQISPHNMLHLAYHGSLTSDVISDQNNEFPIYPESATRRLLWNAWLPDAFLNPHGYPTHEWVQPFSGYSAWVITRMGAAGSGRTNWVPRGWFTSLGYLSDPAHPDSRKVVYALRDQIVNEMAKTPGVLDMNAQENGRYERYQHWDAESYQQPIYKGVRINMALKGQPAREGSENAVNIGGLMARYPEITWDDGYTEAPDETAWGSFLHLVASAGLAYDHAHLAYMTEGKLDVKHTKKETPEGVQWRESRKRPMMPVTPPDAQLVGVK